MLLPIRPGDGKERTHLVLCALTFAMLTFMCPPNHKAQSIDKNNPTPLRTKEVDGRADFPVPQSGWGRTFYYVFTAKAGRCSAKVTTPVPKNSKTGVRYYISFDQFPQQRRQRRRFPSLEVLDPLAWTRRNASIRFSLAKQTRLIMAVSLSGKFDYQITLDGP
jgi:hypothetical protein